MLQRSCSFRVSAFASRIGCAPGCGAERWSAVAPGASAAVESCKSASAQRAEQWKRRKMDLKITIIRTSLVDIDLVWYCVSWCYFVLGENSFQMLPTSLRSCEQTCFCWTQSTSSIAVLCTLLIGRENVSGKLIWFISVKLTPELMYLRNNGID